MIVDQDLLPRLNLALVAHALRCSQGRHSTEAVCSNVTWPGFRTTFDSEAHAYSAKAPRHEPNTQSPGLNWITVLPTLRCGRHLHAQRHHHRPPPRRPDPR